MIAKVEVFFHGGSPKMDGGQYRWNVTVLAQCRSIVGRVHIKAAIWI